MFGGAGVESYEVLEELGRGIARPDGSGPGDARVADELVALVRLRSAITAGIVHRLGALESSAFCEREHGLTAPAWVARETGAPLGELRGETKVARRLRDQLPEVDDALVEGRILAAHAKVLADTCTSRIAEGIAELQGDLVDLAEGMLFDPWRAEVRGIVALLDQDGGHDPEADLARNQLRVTDTIDGVTHLAGMLVGEHALVARMAVEGKADELFRRFTADHETAGITVPARPTLLALAFLELCRLGTATEVHTSAPRRPEVTLVVHADAPMSVTDADGVRLADGTTRTLRCDPDIRSIVVDRLGVPLDAGRTARLATPAQRRAVTARDGGCVFPGCTAPMTWCDLHHIIPFEHGGRTDTVNLAALCRSHHGITHRSGWSMYPTDDQWFRWRTPTGREFDSQRHHRRRPQSPPEPDG